MRYCKNLFSSFFDLSVYYSFIKNRTRKALGHFLLSLIIIGAILGWQIQVRLIPPIRERLQTSLIKIVENYPSDLIINWDGNQLTTEPDQYHQLTLDFSQLPLFAEFGDQNLLILYSNEELNLEQASMILENQQNQILINQTSLITWSTPTSLLERELDDYLGSTPLTINQDSLSTLYNLINTNLTDLINVISFLLIPLTMICLPLVRLLVSLILATLLWLPASMGKVIKSWQESWRFTLVLMVVVEIIHWLSVLLYPNSTFSIYSISFWVLSLFILFSLGLQIKSTQLTKKA